MPVGASTFAEALRTGAEIFHTLKSELKKAGHNTNVSWAPLPRPGSSRDRT